MSLLKKGDSLRYHQEPLPGKLELCCSKTFANQKDLSMAYSPGVAEPCLAIKDNPADVNIYTGRKNLVCVLTNGTAVLGLGNIGPLAGKPVMEGKSVLFKMFADINAFDIEITPQDPAEFIKVAQALEPTFGGINLEDIKAPECFIIEDTLKATMRIPIFHDDQHGTAIISGAGILNGLEIANRKIEDTRIVVYGAGAAGIACARYYITLGIMPENIFMFDSKGHISRERTDLNDMKKPFALQKHHSVGEALKGAHMFMGFSQKDLLTAELIQLMDKDPIIFACANPDPEISYPVAKAARPDGIIGTGRSDYPNQINNVSGFPYIFRGALDVAATEINEAMKLAATRALAALAKEPVPEEVSAAYNNEKFSFGHDYVIPKPLDPRLIEWLTPAVAQAAMDTGVAQSPIPDMDEYRKALRRRVEAGRARSRYIAESFVK